MIHLTSLFDNEQTHHELKLLMMRHKQLNIRLSEEENAWISSKGITGLCYQLKDDNWRWLVNYLQTGEYEDFGIFPSDLPRLITGTQEEKAKELIEQQVNVARIPFLRETQAFVKLRALFKYGKLFFSIRRTDDFMDYLNSKGL